MTKSYKSDVLMAIITERQLFVPRRQMLPQSHNLRLQLINCDMRLCAGPRRDEASLTAQ